MSENAKVRVLARSIARELTSEEIDQVSGGTDGSYTRCDWSAGQSYSICLTSYSPNDVQIDDSRVSDMDA